MEKAYTNGNGEESSALPSGEGSSIGSQWDAGLDLDVAQAIITSSFQIQGYRSSSKNVSDCQNGEMSLEEEVNSLDLKQVVIDDDEIKEMEKEQANAATEGSADRHSGREDLSVGHSHQIASNNDLLNDIDSLIASSLSPVNSSPVNAWLESPGWTDTNGHLNKEKLNAELNSSQGTGKRMNKQAHISSPSSTSTEQHLHLGEEVSYQFSPSSAHVVQSPSTPSDVSSHLGNSRMKEVTSKSPEIDTFQTSPQTFNIQNANLQGKSLQKNDAVDLEIAEGVSQILEHEGNLLSPTFTQCQNVLSVKDLEASSGCQMHPVGYADDDDSESNDEHCISGELIPHGRGSGRGRPKSAQPVRNSVPREIRPKSDIPTYTNIFIPVTIIERADDNKSYLEGHPIVSPPHKPSSSTPSSVSSIPNKAVSPSLDNNPQPGSIKSPSMECVEGDGPISFTGSSHQIFSPGHLPPNFLVQNVMSHNQDYNTSPQYHGTLFTQQSINSRRAMNHNIRNHSLQHGDIQEQTNLHQYQEEPPFQYKSASSAYPAHTMDSYENLRRLKPNSEICHQTIVPSQKSSVLPYQEVHQEPSRTPASHYIENPSKGSNLVVADPEQLKRAGIPFIVVTQAPVPNHPMPQHIIQTSANPVHPHKSYAPQPTFQKGPGGRPCMDTDIKSQVYQHTLTGNWTAAQITEQPAYNQPLKVGLPIHYTRNPQNKVQAAYYVPPSVTSSISVESSNLPSSRLIYQGPKQQPVTLVHDTTLPSTVDPDILSPSSKQGGRGEQELVRGFPNGFHHLSRRITAHSNHKLDCHGIPKEDKQSRTEAWIMQTSKMPSHHIHPYELYPHMASCSDAGPTLPSKAVGLFQGVEIAGPSFKKDSGKVGDGKQKGGKKGRSNGKMKKVDTNNSHQVYIKNIHRKAQVNEIIGHSSQEVDKLNKARPSSNDLTYTDKQTDRILAPHMRNNMSKNQIQERVNIFKDETNQDKTIVRDDFAEADKEINKIVLEKSMRENQRKNSLDPLEKYSAFFDESLFDSTISSGTTSQNLGLTTIAASASQATASSLEWNIDPNQYLSSKDRESLEKNIHHQNNSLEKYLRMGNSNNSNKNIMNDPNSQTRLKNHLNASDVSPQLPVHHDESPFTGGLDHSQGQKSAHPPKEMAKIDILAWQEQSSALEEGMAGMQRPYVVKPQFDTANPSAHDFPQLLQSLTSPGDEDMKSASLELSSNSVNIPAKHCLNPSHGYVNTTAASRSSQHQCSNTRNVHTDLPVKDMGYVSLTPDEHCFRRPHHPSIKDHYLANCGPFDNINTHSQQTSLSACISHPQPLMASSVALASSQPMSSMKGDSDVSMHSDLSRHSRQDRSMSSVDGKLQQIPEFLKQSHSAVVKKDKLNGSHRSRRETVKVNEWLEQQEAFLRQQDDKINSHPKKNHLRLNTHNALTLNIPKHLETIDLQEMHQQYQILQEPRQHELHQEHRELQQIPAPTSPPFDMNSPFQDHLHDELDYGSYVVPGFSPTDLLPRCGSGKSDKPPRRPQSGSQSVKGKDPTPTSSSISQAIVSDTSTSHNPLSVSSPLPTSNKQPPPKQKISKNVTATALDTSRPTTSVSLSSPSSRVSLLSPSVASNGDHTRLVTRPSLKADSNYGSPDSTKIVKTKASSVASSQKASDVLVVGEKMKACVKISTVPSTHHAGAATGADDEEEEEGDDEELVEGEDKGEEEELSFTGSDVFRPDDQGETILHCLCDISSDNFEDLASAPGFEEAVNSSNKAQETPLFVGVHNRRPDVAKFLMKKGADVSIPCISPANTFRNEPLLQSAIHEAAELGDAKTLNVLLQSEDVDIDLPRPGSGQTPLMVALHIHSFAHRNSSANRTRVVKLLLTQGASMTTIQDAVEGKTPFMYAIQSRDIEIVNTFFRLMDADEARDAVTTKTSRSTTCLHFAAGLSNFDRNQKMELIRILILNGADTSSKNAEGESPRDWARDEIDEVLRRLVPGR